jgi:hypothetical protein
MFTFLNFQLSACLTHEELNKFAVLMKRWRAKEMPILEFAQKLMELYGMERKHLLASKIYFNLHTWDFQACFSRWTSTRVSPSSYSP